VWEIEFSQEASNYALDSHPYNEAVLIAIEDLAASESGLPMEGSYQLLEQWYVWEIANLTVVYELEPHALYIWVIKPGRW
jgi:hypothetical protein